MPATPTLRQTALDLLDLVHTVSGYPVVVEVEPALKVISTLKMARGAVALHTIQYDPARVREPDYHVAVLCGHILRFFALPPADRRDLAPTAAGLAAVHDLVARETARKAPAMTADTIASYAQMLHEGVLVQLHSMPVEMRVQKWISETYPEWEEVQRASVLRQLDEYVGTLAPNIRGVTPSRVYRASTSMNAAVAKFWAGEYLLPDLVKPYSRAGLAMDGARLLSIWRQVPEDAAHDPDLVDAWARALNIRGWYDWVPYDSPGGSSWSERDAQRPPPKSHLACPSRTFAGTPGRRCRAVLAMTT